MYIHIFTLEVHMYIYGGVHTCTYMYIHTLAHICTHACHEDIINLITWNWNYAMCVN